MSEEMYQLLKQRDKEIAALRGLLEALRSQFADAVSEHEGSEAWSKAYEELGNIFYEHGFKTDGSFRA